MSLSSKNALAKGKKAEEKKDFVYDPNHFAEDYFPGNMYVKGNVDGFEVLEDLDKLQLSNERMSIDNMSEPDESYTYNEPVVENYFVKLGERFTEQSGMKRSAEFKEVRRALNDVFNDQVEHPDGGSLIDQINSKCELVFGSDQFKKYLRLNEALMAYIYKHADSRDGEFKSAVELRKALSNVAYRRDVKDIIEANDVDFANVSEEEKHHAEKNVDQMFKYYIAFCKQIGKDMISSDEEKLRARWNVLKTCERDLLIMDANGRYQYTGNRKFMLDEYSTIRDQIYLIRYSKEHGETEAYRNDIGKTIRDHAYDMMGKEREEKKEEGLGNSEEGMTQKQLEGLEKIDAWVIRNIRNGGYMTFGLNKTDRTDFASKLLSLSKRKRLYIYYLVETRERLEPTTEGFVKSQVIYEPNLAKFKDHMIASKAKFYKRFSGGYIYWNKLSEAMAIADQAEAPLMMMDDIMKEEKPAADIPDPEYPETMTEERREKLKDLMKNLIEAMRLTKERKERGLPAGRSREIKTRLSVLSGERKALANEIRSIQEKIQEEKGQERHAKDRNETIEKFTGEIAYNTSKVLGMGKSIAKISMGTEELISKLVETSSASTLTSMEGLSSLVSCIGSILLITDSHSKLTNLDMINAVSDATLSLAKVVKAGADIAALFTDNSIISTVAAAGVGVGLQGVSIILGGVKTASYLTNGYRRSKASELAKKEKGEDKFREGMLKLNRRLGKKQRTSAIGGLTTATFSTAALGLVASSVILPVFGVIAGGLLLGAGIGLKCSDHGSMKKMRGEMNDAFFEVDSILSKAEAKWKEEHPNETFSDAKRETMKKQIMRRMAGELGYYSPNHMAVTVAKSYASYLFEGAKNDDNHGEMCRAMIRGLGLYYKPDPDNDDNTVPKISDIAAKLCG